MMKIVEPLRTLKYGEVEVGTYPDNDGVGRAVAAAFALAAKAALAERESIAVILATGNSQLSFAEAVTERDDIDWSRITVLHMDEYIGMGEDHPASFRRWMRERIVDKAHVGGFEGVRGDHVPVVEEIDRYTALIRDLRPSITVMGIGENGHLAFNDPPADFETDDVIRVVTMDERSRRQQVGEGHFRTLDEMPRQALSLTIPALLNVDTVLVGVPELRKAEAVQKTLEGPISPDCPASILRRVAKAHLFLDQESASRLAPR